MTLRFTLIIQIAALFFQLVLPEFPVIPDSWRPAIQAFVSFLQAVQAILAHQKNPDGSPAQLAYEPKK